jgi:transposase
VRKDGVHRAQDADPRIGRSSAVRRSRCCTPKELAQSLGVSEQTLRNWRRRGEADRRERTDVPTSAELEELRALRRENARLKQERDLLKRAAAFVAAENERR